MALEIITAEQRMAEKRGHKMVICGQSGVGKTTLARTLDPDKTLFIDLEAGDTAIKDFPIDVLLDISGQVLIFIFSSINCINSFRGRKKFSSAFQ